MPEEIFDPVFNQRVIRLLQLRRGRGIAEVDDTVIPVIDLGAALQRAEALLPSETFAEDIATAMKGYRYSRYFPMEFALGPTDLPVGQIFNPEPAPGELGRLVIVHRVIMVIGLPATRGIAWRHHDTQLTTAHPKSPPLNLRRDQGASTALMRTQIVANPPQIPIATMGAIIHWDLGPGSRASIMQGMIFPLAPGNGISFYATDDAPGGSNADPAPFPNLSYKLFLQLIEVPFEGL